MSKRLSLPPCDAGPYFAGEPRTLRLLIPELESLEGLGLLFTIARSSGNIVLDRDDGLRASVTDEGEGVVMVIPIPGSATEGLNGSYSWRAQVVTDEGPVTVAYGDLTLTPLT